MNLALEKGESVTTGSKGRGEIRGEAREVTWGSYVYNVGMWNLHSSDIVF